uniref:Small-subunit processome Utp12 domain-containing protein n=1 Tax=Tetradesmus obliquus TaxID=3088 RepID=A0A383W0U0_TETOB|eukprot:jgi/Sobl393_1/4824/SZX70276.1
MLPGRPLDGLLCAFSRDSSTFALGTPDGRVRTYDTVTGRLRSSLASAVGALAAKNGPGGAAGHLAEGHTCLAWVDTEDDGKGMSRSWVAVGTSSGAVKLYDSATGEVKWQTNSCNEGGVDCLAYSASSSSSSSTLLSSGRDGQVCSLEPAKGSKRGTFKGSKHAVTAAALSADGSKLILGGSSLSVWDMAAQQRTSKLTGHPLPVQVLAFAPGAGFALSAAEGERLVAVWATPSKQGGRKKAGAGAAASLAVEQPVVGLSTVAAEGEAPGAFFAAATTEAGEAYVWLITPQGDTAVASQQVAHIVLGAKGSRGSSNASGECILAAALEPRPGGATLLLAAGTPAKPRFERLPVSSSDSSSKVTYLQPAAADGLIRPGAAAAAAAANGPAAAEAAAVQRQNGRDVDMLGPDYAGEAVQQRVSSKASRKRQEPEPEAAAAAAAAAGEDADADALGEDDDEEMEALGEQTLEQRIASLEQQQQQQQEAAMAAAGGSQQQQQQPGAAASLPPGPVKADSLSVLLSQALRSGDRALLEQCLGVANERVITNSVKRLVPLDAALLLRAAVERLQSRPVRGQQMAGWIHAVLLHHTAYLMAAPGAAPVMSSLYSIIEARLSVQRQLLSLAGRLELLLAQAGGQAGAAAAAAAGAEEAATTGPQVVYQESDSEAEVEVVDAAGGYDDDEDDEGGFYTDEDGDDDEDDELGDGDSEGDDDDD